MKDSVKAPLLVTGAVVSFATMSTLAKLSGNAVPSIEIVFFRALLGLPIVILLAHRQKVSLKGTQKGLLLIRGIVGSIALIMFFFAVTRIPVGNAMLLNQATPIFILPLAALFLGEKVTKIHVLLTLIAVSGVALVVEPSQLVLDSPALIALGSALFTALAYISVHKLARTENYLTIIFWFNCVALVMISPFVFQSFVWPPTRTLVLLVFMALFATLGQVLLTIGYKYGDAGKLAIIGSLGAIFGGFYDLLVWGHIPSRTNLIGGIIVIASCTLIQMLRARPNVESAQARELSQNSR